MEVHEFANDLCGGVMKGLPVLSFPSYYGVLSRAPTRLSPDLPRCGEGGARPEAT
jgi:hypothetical protein